MNEIDAWMEINALKTEAASDMFPIDMRNRGVPIPRGLHPQSPASQHTGHCSHRRNKETAFNKLTTAFCLHMTA